MCGIAGFLYAGNNPIPLWANKNTLENMLATISHRGPDGRGIEIGNGYGLGHVRLSIIDTSELGHQPMWSDDKRYVLSYNGEIYNFKKLKSDLERKGYNFKSECDTEVLLYGLIEWKELFFNKLEGMFAGVFTDTYSGDSIIFRDHLGIKPLYYAHNEGSIIFASEVKALKPVLSNFHINMDAVFEHINFRYVAGDRTLYQGVKRLLPGHYIKFSSDGITELKKFFDLKDSMKSRHRYTSDEVEHAVNESIKAHTLSDVGYSVQLSGGIDSTYITHCLKKDKSLDTYSVSLEGSPDSEESYQRHVVDICDTHHHNFLCNGSMFADLLPEVTRHLDFPIVHGGSIFLYKLCEEIQKKHKVVLTGEGADELFLGYSRYNIPISWKISHQLKQLNIPSSLIPNLPKFRAIKNLMQRELSLETGMYHSDAIPKILNIKGDYSYRRDCVKGFSSLIEQMIITDQHAYLGALLERQDKTSMAHSVEVRVPFCNHKLFEMINSISHNEKTKPVPKAILKSLLAKNFSHDFVYRRKNGFRTPLNEWFRDDKMLGRYFSYLLDKTFTERGIYNSKFVSQMIDEHRQSKHDYGQELFGLLSFEIWARECL